MTTVPGPVFHVWLLATVPGRADVTIHASAEIDGGIAGAFDRLVPKLVAELRREVTGEKS